MAAVVVFPEPLSPVTSTVDGEVGPVSKCFASPPRISTSTSLVILTTCCPGVRLFITSSVSACSLILATNSRATRKLTSASKRAFLISRRASSTSFSVSLPLLPKGLKTPASRSDKASNMKISSIGTSVYGTGGACLVPGS